LYTSDNNQNILKHLFLYIASSAFLALFGAVYEHFSFGVFSYYMIYAFAFPLFLGALPLIIIAASKKQIPSCLSLKIWNFGIATLSVGSIVKGILNIYGTTNRLLIVYPAAGVLLLFAGLITCLKK